MPSVDLGAHRLLSGLDGQLSALLAGLGRGALVAKALSPWLGALLVVAGAAALVVGARWRRPIAAGGGLVVGALVGLALQPVVASRVGAVDRTTAAAVGAAVVGAAGALVPAAFPFVAGALPGALLGRPLAIAGSTAIGAGVGALVGGGIAVFFADVVAALVASAVGAALAGAGLIALFRARPFVADAAARPFLLLAWIVVLAIAGAALQRGRAFGRGGAAGPGRGAAPSKLEGP